MNAFRMVGITTVLMTVIASLSGCTDNAPSPSSQPAKSEPPAKLDGHAVKEAELSTITLTTDAENRLGIRVEEAQMGGGAEPRRFSGEVTVPPGNSFVVSSPVAGILQAAAGAIPPVGSAVRKDQPDTARRRLARPRSHGRSGP
jgi:hypothetical protein